MNRVARVYMHGVPAGMLEEIEPSKLYRFAYLPSYDGPPISLTLPRTQRAYEFDSFPAFFDGLLPEGKMLEALLRQRKIDQRDYFSQLGKRVSLRYM